MDDSGVHVRQILFVSLILTGQKFPSPRKINPILRFPPLDTINPLYAYILENMKWFFENV